MEHQFWHDKWKDNDIAFHEADANQLLVAHFKELPIASSDRVFVPLCGKTRDIAWLLSKGQQVAGVELSELAVKQLFEDLDVQPMISTHGGLKRYSANSIDILVGDIFKLTREVLGSIDAVYDRAALVALPEDIRTRYCKHVADITCTAPQLLITFEYDQRVMPGPPFSISTAKLNEHYAPTFQIKHIVSVAVAGGLKGKCDAVENAWLLQRATA